MSKKIGIKKEQVGSQLVQIDFIYKWKLTITPQCSGSLHIIHMQPNDFSSCNSKSISANIPFCNPIYSFSGYVLMITCASSKVIIRFY